MLVHYSYDLYEKSFKKCVKDGKACGPDNVRSKHLKLIGPKNSGLHEVIKHSITPLLYPTDWKAEKVTCLYKKGSPQDCNNYRPITLLSIPSKILEKMSYAIM